MPDLDARIHGGLLGLAIGDAIGLPADYHRSIRSPWVRSRLWEASADLDRSRVSRPLLPFVLSSTDEPRLVPTDDTEAAVLALRVLLDTTDHGDGALFTGWSRHALAEDAWGGVAERSAAINAGRGLLPPHTGNDNPADISDSAVPAGLAIGLAFAGEPELAADHAERWASITHARDGVWAAVAAAVATALLAAGATADDALAQAVATIPVGSWLATDLTRLAEIDLGDPFLALPRLLEVASPRAYSAGGSAPETLPLAFALFRATLDRPTTAIPFASTISRHSDSLPAFVGALVGAHHGASAFGDTWPGALDEVHGLFYPTLAGQTLTGLTAELIARATHRA
ncbi:ADP-ribosylglycohydrolase family protein [Leifsonia poae]|uniref:ADP-ribosylglycohydrolase family protein n=1 Tax=Leifsonia poae TaxID=110933 RepID=UPI001CBF985C|nr:ADP-ribosylglycohydrolase family protein [Leifsonia poae]